MIRAVATRTSSICKPANLSRAFATTATAKPKDGKKESKVQKKVPPVSKEEELSHRDPEFLDAEEPESVGMEANEVTPFQPKTEKVQHNADPTPENG